MTSRPWADGPYNLLPLPGASMDTADHASTLIANDMAIAHNCIIRGLNAIYIQAPLIQGRDDIASFLLFVQAWTSWLIQHHRMEDEGLFDSFETIASSPGLLEVNHRQHQAFEDGIRRMQDLADVAVAQFDPSAIHSLIDQFGPSLHGHLVAEIDTLLALRPYSHDKLLESYRATQAKLSNTSAEEKASSKPIAPMCRANLPSVVNIATDPWPPRCDVSKWWRLATHYDPGAQESCDDYMSATRPRLEVPSM